LLFEYSAQMIPVHIFIIIRQLADVNIFRGVVIS
jgi:hypothetical protein